MKELVEWVQRVVIEGERAGDMESVRAILDEAAKYLRACHKVELWLLRGDFRENH